MSRPENPGIESRILAAALDELSRVQPEKVTMRRVAGKAGITATTIYYYFKNRDELFEAVKFRCIDDMTARMTESDPGGASFVRRLRCAMRAFADWCFENPEPARLVMERLPANLSPAPDKLPRYYRASQAARSLFEAAAEAGELHSDNPDLDLAVALAALWGAVQLSLDHRFDPALWDSGSAVVDRAIDTILGRLTT